MYSDTQNFTKPLIFLTVLYLFLPNTLFFYYWFRNPYSFLLVLTLIVALVIYVRKYISSGLKTDINISKRELLVFAIIASVWVIISGVGNYVPQYSDFQGHNAKLYDLVHSEWPLIYDYNNDEVIYYFSYYLVPAFVMKLADKNSLIPFVVWTGMGFYLMLIWAYFLLNKNIYKLILFFTLGTSTIIFNQVFGLERNIWPVNFGSIFEQSLWVPNQIPPTFLVMVLFAYFMKNNGDLKAIVFPLVLTLTWCVFPMIIIVLIFGVSILIYRNYEELTGLIKHGLIYLVLVIPLFIFYLSSNGDNFFEFLPLTTNRTAKVPIWVTQLLPQLILLLIYLKVFIKDPKDKKMALFILVLMFIISVFRVGVFNDLAARGFMVIYIAFFYLFLKNIDFGKTNMRVWLIIFLFDSFVSLKVIYSRLTTNVFVSKDKEMVIYAYDRSKSIYEMFVDYGNSDELLQYSSKKDSFYQKYLSREEK